MTWLKDGKEIDKRLNIEITNAIGYSTIFVRDASRDHRGVYRVEAKNASGAKQAEITVRVQGNLISFFLNFPYVILTTFYLVFCPFYIKFKAINISGNFILQTPQEK